MRPQNKWSHARANGARHLPLLVALLTLATLCQLSDALRFTSVQMPALVQRGTNFWLGCQYELQGASSGGGGSGTSNRRQLSNGGEQLYSVKWYRNNNEFYRLIFTGSGQQQADQSSPAAAGAAVAAFQQQQFSQAGVNVLMSASNATHVRLLNASLESDGSYACEISTQNLSTIRHEKEIKVYVLPHLKLNLIGLRNLYAPGERVELNCLSDFSRPAGALGWFINGQQIKAQAGAAAAADSQGRHFELGAASTRSKASEPKLTRTSLALKFKLTRELLAAAASGDDATGAARRAPTGGGGNQSKEASDPIPGARLFELLKLECRYKLTEVSDVTFNELRVSASARPAAARRTGSGRNPPDEQPATVAAAVTEAEEESLRARRASRMAATAAGATGPRVTKSHGTQVSQSSCPARRSEVLAALATRTAQSGGGGPAASCHLDMLAREDPIILRPESDELDGQEEEQDEAQLQTVAADDELELPLGAELAANCSTLGALTELDLGHFVSRGSTNQRLRHSGRALLMMMADNEPQQGHASVYCSEPAARRRLLVSGRAAAAQEQRDLQQQQQQQQRLRQQHTAYVASSTAQFSQHHQLDTEEHHRDQDKLSFVPADTSNSAPRKSLGGGGGGRSGGGGQLHHAAAAWDGGGGGAPDELAAPPLLEWFINNQEAPSSSASYAPELPLQAASSGPGTELPSIDYTQYFANFAHRPVEQHLMLQMRLEKRHFMTPDSLLRLRCTSTQAQVLAADSLTVAFVVVPPGQALPNSVQQHHHESEQQVNGSHWSQSIKPKYVHQTPRLSQRNRALVADSQRRRFINNNKQPVLAASASQEGNAGSRVAPLSQLLAALGLLVLAASRYNHDVVSFLLACCDK